MMIVPVPPTGNLHDLIGLVRFFEGLKDGKGALDAIEQCIAERKTAEEFYGKARAETEASASLKRDADLAIEGAAQAAQASARSEAQAQAALEALSAQRQELELKRQLHDEWIDRTNKEIAADRAKLASQDAASASLKAAATQDRELASEELEEAKEQLLAATAMKQEIETKLAAIRAAAGV